jgi:hypothetical protein
MKPLCQRLAAVLLALPSFQVSATTRYVDVNNASPASPYTNWVTAATNIQDAVFRAGTGDTVLVTNGIYQYGGYSFNGSNRVYIIGKNLTVQSVNGPAVTVIKGYQVPGTTNGNNAVRCVYLESGLTLSGFTLTNGATQTSGTPNGGGIYCQSTSALVTNCVIVGNAAISGGGVYSGTLINCALIGNIAGLPNISSGGGAAQSTLINCLLTGNQAGYRGGAAAGCTLISCTIASNVGQVDGIDGSKLTNCISYYNFYDNGTGSGDGNVFNNCCTIPLPYSGVNIITNPPAFVNLTNGDFHLQPWSPCINAGNNSFITNSTDLDGNPRIVAGIVDIGAYEFQSPVRYVSVSNTAPVLPFTNWVTAATNIQDAIDAANAGDFIVVSNGIYSTGGRVVYGNSTNRVVVNKPVTVQSVNGPAATTIQGYSFRASSVRCVYLTNGASLVGFMLTNGGAIDSGDVLREQSGGGVWCEDTSAVVSNCVITRGFAYQNGGGAYQGTLLNCVLANNNADFGGGGAFQGSLFNCVLTNNSAAQGGGTCSNTLVNCTLIKNFAQYQNLNSGGGSIYCTLSNCVITANNCWGGGGGAAFSTLTGCTVSNNTANAGGGGLCTGFAINCVISSNRTSNIGGGAYSNTLVNCVLKNNLASSIGGGAYQSALVNCIVVSNAASGPSVQPVGGGMYGGSATNSIIYYNLALKDPNFSGTAPIIYCCTTPLPAGSGNITNDPIFVNLSGGDFHLQTNSPCINSGNNTYVTGSTDLDGHPRISGGTVDIGAYEFQSPSSVLSYAWAQQYGLPTDGTADYADADNDGMNNWQEWKAGTNPTNALSVLKMTSATPTNNPAGLVVTWQSMSGITYFLQSSSNLVARPSFSTIQSNIVGQAGTTSYLDTTTVGDGPFFYRVGVQ